MHKGGIIRMVRKSIDVLKKDIKMSAMIVIYAFYVETKNGTL